MAKAKAVTVKEETPLAIAPDFLKEGAGRGSDNVGIDDLVIPRIELIQDLSPQRKSNKDEYIEGAVEGMAYNTVTSTLFDAVDVGVSVIPVFFRKEFIIWRDRDLGGGFNGAFPTEALAVAHIASGEVDDPEQVAISETDQQFCLVQDPITGKWESAVFSMANTKQKASRQWNSLIAIGGGDRFSRVYNLKGIQVDGKKGEYYNWQVRQVGFVPNEDLYRQAEELYESIAKGEREVAYEGTKEEEVSDTVG
jgi:hypothetical protein